MNAILPTATAAPDPTTCANGFTGQHLAQHGLNNLHLGCGNRVLPGWVNTDLSPGSADILQLDATQTFPFRESTFDYIFSEHMIEHIAYEGGLKMLQECLRVLKPGGRIRISTPDLQFLINLYALEKTPLQQAYLQWAAGRFVPSGIATDTFVINSFVRNWGHLFIYDAKTLRNTLLLAGFEDISCHQINASGIPVFQGLEHEGRMPSGFLQLETMTMEACKPAAGKFR